MRYWIILLILIKLTCAATVPLTHPSTVQTIGANTYNCMGQIIENSIDLTVGDTTTFWCFTSNYGDGAEYSIQAASGINLESVTIQTISTGDKSISIKIARVFLKLFIA